MNVRVLSTLLPICRMVGYAKKLKPYTCLQFETLKLKENVFKLFLLNFKMLFALVSVNNKLNFFFNCYCKNYLIYWKFILSVFKRAHAYIHMHIRCICSQLQHNNHENEFPFACRTFFCQSCIRMSICLRNHLTTSLAYVYHTDY